MIYPKMNRVGPFAKVSPLFLPQNEKTSYKSMFIRGFNLSGDPAGTRTQDPYIKSVLLYQLSYGIEPFPAKKGISLFSLGVQK